MLELYQIDDLLYTSDSRLLRDLQHSHTLTWDRFPKRCMAFPT